MAAWTNFRNRGNTPAIAAQHSKMITGSDHHVPHHNTHPHTESHQKTHSHWSMIKYKNCYWQLICTDIFERPNLYTASPPEDDKKLELNTKISEDTEFKEDLKLNDQDALILSQYFVSEPCYHERVLTESIVRQMKEYSMSIDTY